MMLLNYESLFEPYTKDGHTLENTLKYLRQEADKHNIPTEIMEIAINEVFTQMAQGRTFSKTKCSCGCGLDKAATDLIHTIRDTMLNLNKDYLSKANQILQDRFNTAILSHIHKMNDEYIKEQMPYNPTKEKLLSAYYKFMNVNNSPVIKFFKGLKHGS